MKDLLVIIVLVVLSLAGAARSVKFGGTQADFASETIDMAELEEGVETTGTTIYQANSFSDDTVMVENQPAGDAVAIESVTFSAPGWIAIHEDRAGKPGNNLGAAWFPKGTHRNVTVNLVRRTVSGAHYYAILQRDNGNKEYELKIDSPILDSAGNRIIMRFDTTSEENL